VQPHALVPGTFDPPTLGHPDLIRRAAALFGRVTIGVAAHPTKAPMLTVRERVALLTDLVADLDGVCAVPIDGLLVDACEALFATAIVRGVRNGTDLDYEVPMANTNRAMLPRIDTVFLAPAPEVAHVSSTLVRQIFELNGDVRAMVPPAVAAALRARR
jgi:pantetheine-phosphate adenylyltransferase